MAYAYYTYIIETATSFVGLSDIDFSRNSAAQEQRNAVEAMIRSAGSSLFDTAGGVLPLAAVGIGVAAVQWPTVASAASASNADAGTNAGSWIAG